MRGDRDGQIERFSVGADRTWRLTGFVGRGTRKWGSPVTSSLLTRGSGWCWSDQCVCIMYCGPREPWHGQVWLQPACRLRAALLTELQGMGVRQGCSCHAVRHCQSARTPVGMCGRIQKSMWHGYYPCPQTHSSIHTLA